MIYYAIGLGTGAVKIGHTSGEPADRLAALATGSPVELLLFAARPGDLARERALHRRYASHRTRGEWFRLALGADVPEEYGGHPCLLRDLIGLAAADLVSCWHSPRDRRRALGRLDALGANVPATGEAWEGEPGQVVWEIAGTSAAGVERRWFVTTYPGYGEDAPPGDRISHYARHCGIERVTRVERVWDSPRRLAPCGGPELVVDALIGALGCRPEPATDAVA